MLPLNVKAAHPAAKAAAGEHTRVRYELKGKDAKSERKESNTRRGKEARVWDAPAVAQAISHLRRPSSAVAVEKTVHPAAAEVMSRAMSRDHVQRPEAPRRAPAGYRCMRHGLPFLAQPP